jgi:hypothetical protein
MELAIKDHPLFFVIFAFFVPSLQWWRAAMPCGD